MKKNVAGQKIGGQLVSATDGSAFTGSVTVYVTGDAGTQAAGSVGSGACAHEGNGYHTYAPSQAETNYDLVAFTFIGSGAVPATVQVFTSFPQTGDNFARIGAPVGASISADIAAVQSLAVGIDAKTTNLPSDPADESLIIAATNSLAALIGTPAVTVSADIAAVKSDSASILADTNELQTDWANDGRLDSILDARASQASVDVVDGVVDSIKADTAATLVYATRTVIRGTVDSGASTTNFTASALSPAGVDADQFKGRIIVFDNDTATAALRGEATDITGNTAAALPAFTFSALTTAPASGDTYSIV